MTGLKALKKQGIKKNWPDRGAIGGEF